MRHQRSLIPILGAAVLIAASAVPVAAVSDDAAPFDLQARLTEFVGLVPGGAAALTVHDGVTTTAVAGIASAAGDQVEIDTPFWIGPAGHAVNSVIALQLADEGRIDLDAPIVTYLPDAPVDAQATVRDLMTHRAGVPDVLGPILKKTLADPGHTWTMAEMVDFVEPGASGPVGAFAPNYTNHIMLQQLVSSVAGSELASSFDSRIGGPLGLEATAFSEQPDGTAAGWELGLGLNGDRNAESTAWWTFGPGASTVGDLATLAGALLDGRLLSDEATATMFDKDATSSAYGFELHDEVFGDLGDLGARYFLAGGATPQGFNTGIAIAPENGDVIVVLANNEQLETVEFIRDIVSAWAPAPTTTAAASITTESGSNRFFVNPTCDFGQGSTLSLPACEADETGLRITMLNPAQRSGPFEGSQVLDGVVVVNPADGSFTYSGLVTFMGTVEGCGTGTLYLSAEGEGTTGPNGISTFTRNISTIVSGGSLTASGSLDEAGTEFPFPDGTASLDYIATYSCEAPVALAE